MTITIPRSPYGPLRWNEFMLEFACMYIERMIACDFLQSSSMSNVEEYRRKIALEIFAHSDEVTS
ncbi:hypothetical protein CASFOL_007599 [Castilleja foliolosa]|uniref:Uncharacterized protein n=1 Tax=Castilleja foliolosa TaxID=1961234 RepID=A0ABD3E518_9LAMI